MWVYRVQEEDMDGTRSALSQTIIEIASNEDKVKPPFWSFNLPLLPLI